MQGIIEMQMGDSVDLNGDIILKELGITGTPGMPEWVAPSAYRRGYRWQSPRGTVAHAPPMGRREQAGLGGAQPGRL